MRQGGADVTSPLRARAQRAYAPSGFHRPSLRSRSPWAMEVGRPAGINRAVPSSQLPQAYASCLKWRPTGERACRAATQFASGGAGVPPPRHCFGHHCGINPAGREARSDGHARPQVLRTPRAAYSQNKRHIARQWNCRCPRGTTLEVPQRRARFTTAEKRCFRNARAFSAVS